jgi:glyoxylase-like metal-dependent hydrolase (beta-lactamase superfamily II)/8-oxo-dGTP pyrophosphatase MutT (NUDIX family)
MENPATPPIVAASILLARDPGSSEVFLVLRGEALRFFGGFWAFPGGRLDPADPAVPLIPTAPDDGLGPRRAAAARELFEETGVLVARAADGSFPRSLPDADRSRREVMEGRLSFAELLVRHGLQLHAGDFRLIGSVTTPPFAPTRFDTTFFLAILPPGQQAEVWPGELDRGRWATAADMLECWKHGECLVSPPTVMLLEAIEGRPAAEAPAQLAPVLEELSGGSIHPIYFAPAVRLIPLRTVALPPSTHTNAFLVGRDPAYLIDPGPTDPDEQSRLFELLDAEHSAGRRLAAIVLTHQHPDHIGAVNPCAERYGLPVWAHPLTAEALHGRIAVGRLIRDGERLDLGACPDGSGPWSLEAIHTPGHAAGHLVFFERRYQLLFVGDMVSTVTSIVIAPPEGDLAVYLESLRRLQRFDCRLLLPAHGNVSARPAETLAEALAHRARREEQLLEVLRAKPRTVGELTSELYQGLPEGVMRFARLQTEAGLEKLRREERIEATGEGETSEYRVRMR